jgi:hypothetical protein
LIRFATVHCRRQYFYSSLETLCQANGQMIGKSPEATETDFDVTFPTVTASTFTDSTNAVKLSENLSFPSCYPISLTH